MILDGERIKHLISQAKKEVIICAPFIKLVPFKLILGACTDGIAVKVITRWRAAEVALGVSDLEIFDIINNRENAELRLVNELHAKLFVADEMCLAGSANVTGAALGWSKKPNLELLMDANSSDLHIKRLIDRIKAGELATHQIRTSVEAEVRKLPNPSFDDVLSIDEEQLPNAIAPWLPQCAAPDKLFKIYREPDTSSVAHGTLADAHSDLQALLPPSGLNQNDFVAYIASMIMELPSFKRILSQVPEKINDAQGIELVAELRKDLNASECVKLWAIVRDWISVFLSDNFEVAPESFVIRLKPHKT